MKTVDLVTKGGEQMRRESKVKMQVKSGRASRVAVALGVVAIAVGAFSQTGEAEEQKATKLTGAVKIDGSSTVYPITEAVAEEFSGSHSGVRITVGMSGTGGGMKKFCRGEIDIADASRAIKESEHQSCKEGKINFIELPVAYDAIAIVVNPKNSWATSMTVAELKKIWEPEAQGKITRWNQIRAEWPDKPFKLFAPGTDSGTFDYFTEAVVGKEDMSRGDYTSSEDDNVLVQGVAGDENALGYFGVAYYEENKAKVKAVAIDGGLGAGATLPTRENVVEGKYHPLSRPLLVYVSETSATRPEVAEFMKFYLSDGLALAQDVGYITLEEQVGKLALTRFEKRTLGTVFHTTADRTAGKLEELFAK